jgi:hypothetical protein
MRGLTNNEFDETLLSIGSHKVARPLSPVEVGKNCEKAVRAGETKRRIATEFGLKGTSMIDRFLKLIELDPDILHLVDWGESKSTVIGFSSASEIIQLPLELHKELANAVCRFKLDKKQTKSVRQLYQRSKRQLEECIADVVARKPVVVVREIIIGAILNKTLIEILAGMHQAERDPIFDNLLKDLYPEIGEFTAKLGERQFTVIGGKSVGNTMAGDKEFETRIGQALVERIQINE